MKIVPISHLEIARDQTKMINFKFYLGYIFSFQPFVNHLFEQDANLP